MLLPCPSDTSTPHPHPQLHILTPHPGGAQRRNQASVYVSLLTHDHPAAAHVLWRLEPETTRAGEEGLRLVLHRPGGAMDGWVLGLSSSASETRHSLGQQVYAVLCEDASRAVTWSCAGNNVLRLRWGDEHRCLTEGAHDARLPQVRFVVLASDAVLGRSWLFGEWMDGCEAVQGAWCLSGRRTLSLRHVHTLITSL